MLTAPSAAVRRSRHRGSRSQAEDADQRFKRWRRHAGLAGLGSLWARYRLGETAPSHVGQLLVITDLSDRSHGVICC